jgi:hypothetical protein
MPQHDRPAAPGGFSMASLTQGQRILGIASLVLLISLFLPWERFEFFEGGEFFGVEVPGSAANISGLSASPLGWLILLAIIGWFVFEGLIIGGVLRGNFNAALISAGIGGLAALLALIQFLLVLGSISWGAFVGLIALLGVGYGAWLRFSESKRMAPPPSAAGPTAPPPAP